VCLLTYHFPHLSSNNFNALADSNTMQTAISWSEHVHTQEIAFLEFKLIESDPFILIFGTDLMESDPFISPMESDPFISPSLLFFNRDLPPIVHSLRGLYPIVRLPAIDRRCPIVLYVVCAY
jgi:hypothetical protein